MKLRRLFCLLLALSFFICGAYSALPCGHVAAAEDVLSNLKEYDVRGEWVFKDSLTRPTDTFLYYVSFYQYSVKDTNLRTSFQAWMNGSITSLNYRKENYPGGPTSIHHGVYKDKWTYADYKKVIIVSTMFCTPEAYEWFIENAVPQFDYQEPSDCLCLDANCDNICDECGELLPMEYWSTALEYLITAGYGIIEQSPLDYFCILYNKKDLAPELIVGETKFEINTSGDILLTKNPKLYKLFEWEDGSFSHYEYVDISKTSDGLYLDPNHYIVDDALRILYSNHSVDNRYVYNPTYDPFGGGSTVGGGADREQATRFDIDVDTYEPIGGLPADPEYGSGRVDVVVSPSAPPVSVPISPTSPVPTPDPSDPVVTPSPDPSEPNSIIIQNQITNIGENIAALPEKLGDKIAGAIKGLFVPSENDFIAIRLKWNLLLEERFGAVYESTAIIDSIVDTFQYSGDMSAIKFPAVTVDLAGTPFTFGGWDVEVIPEGFKFLVSSVKLIVSIVCTVLFVNAMRKKLEGLVNR